MLLEEFFPYKLAITAESFSRRLVAVYGSQFGLSREEWRLLYLLGAAEKIDSLELARRTTLDKVQVSRAAQKLEEKELIHREISPKDRRLRLYRVTEKGRDLYARVVPEVQGRTGAILDRMSAEEQEALMTGLSALHRAVLSESAASELSETKKAAE